MVRKPIHCRPAHFYGIILPQLLRWEAAWHVWLATRHGVDRHCSGLLATGRSDLTVSIQGDSLSFRAIEIERAEKRGARLLAVVHIGFDDLGDAADLIGRIRDGAPQAAIVLIVDEAILFHQAAELYRCCSQNQVDALVRTGFPDGRIPLRKTVERIMLYHDSRPVG
ncbi:hypothetical protein AMJ57_03700 [Parcubacteria bacterium SG8_24]|nr:MAG: hypothetical protein AMJ57_03700 [Parcubacteria bacterium SG8_24]